MWCELSQVWIQSYSTRERMQSKSGKRVQRGGKEKAICSQYRMAKQPRYLLWQMCSLHPVVHTWRSSCLFMLQDLAVDSREPNETRAQTLTHLNHGSIEHLFSGSTLINTVHDEILDTWFLFSWCTARSQTCLCFQTNSCISRLYSFPKKTLHHCSDVKYLYLRGMWHIYVYIYIYLTMARCNSISSSSEVFPYTLLSMVWVLAIGESLFNLCLQ